MVGEGVAVGVGWTGRVAVGGGTGVAVGTTGVDSSEWGLDAASGVVVGAGIELVAVVSGPVDGVPDAAGMTASLLPLASVVKAA